MDFTLSKGLKHTLRCGVGVHISIYLKVHNVPMTSNIVCNCLVEAAFVSI
jgi:hypothetical protein